MSDILYYIAEHPFYCLFLLGVVVLAWGEGHFQVVQ